MSYRIGISGWTYGGWRGVFYPKGMPQRRELEYVARCFNTLEINGSFYSLQRPNSYKSWREQTTDDFLFAVKGGRYITHMRRLRDVEEALANFFASGILELREKLGPILWQFPPKMKLDFGRFADFLGMLPRDTREAAKVARGHAPWMKRRASTRCRVVLPIRYAIEVRDDSFMTEQFMRLLRQHKAALCIADTAGHFPYAEDITADFLYVRLHGAEELYASGYSDRQLDWWAKRLKTWHAGGEPADAKRTTSNKPKRRIRDVYVYFDNDAKVKAPFDASRLANRLGVNQRLAPGSPMPGPGDDS